MWKGRSRPTDEDINTRTERQRDRYGRDMTREKDGFIDREVGVQRNGMA